MKFNNFVKSLGCDGYIYKDEEGNKWLCGLGCAMRVPETVEGVCGRAEISAPDWFNDLVFDDQLKIVNLEGAYLPDARSKTSEVRRVFEGGNVRVAITNKVFGFIEKRDSCYAIEYEHPAEDSNGNEIIETLTALVVPDVRFGAGDEKELLAVMFNVEKKTKED